MIAIASDLMADALRKTRGNITKAAESIGIARNTIHDRLRNDPDLVEVLNEAREIIIERAEENVFDKVFEGDMDASKYVLSTLGRKKGWGNVTEHEHKSQTQVLIYCLPDNGRNDPSLQGKVQDDTEEKTNGNGHA